MKSKPKFFIKANSQKGGYSYTEILTDTILKDVCEKLTNETDYEVEFDYDGYNKGRMALLKYEGKSYYISFSETGKIEGRNYFFQSLTTALVTFYRNQNENTSICFYFLNCDGNIETQYYKFMYRLMKTAGVDFINSKDFLNYTVVPFISIEDLIRTREQNKGKNRSNNSTYLTINESGEIDIYAKTYGANKKEAVLITIAAAQLVDHINLYEIVEQNLKTLPQPDKKALEKIGNIEIITTDIEMEEDEFDKNDSLRSPRFIYNLLDKLGPKKCALCNCEIPELIQGAHIWAVADIKKDDKIPREEKLEYATDGDNGMWLCQNHHKMFDEGIIMFDKDGNVCVKKSMKQQDIQFVDEITKTHSIQEFLSSPKVIDYFEKRYDYNSFDMVVYQQIN